MFRVIPALKMECQLALLVIYFVFFGSKVIKKRKLDTELQGLLFNTTNCMFNY